jgi:Uma2 family endonuclease
MSTAVISIPSVASPPDRLLTIADVAALPSELPSGPVQYELKDGRLIIMPSMKDPLSSRRGADFD